MNQTAVKILKERIKEDHWDSSLCDAMQESWTTDDEGPKSINKMFTAYLTSDPEVQAVIDATLIFAFGWTMNSLVKQATGVKDEE